MKTLRVLGTSGSGKTTVVARLVQALADRRVRVLKHTRHPLDPPSPDKDTGVYVKSGARVSIGLSDHGAECFWREDPPSLETLVSSMEGKVDLLIIEGGRHLGHLPTLLLGDPPPDACLGDVRFRFPARPEPDTVAWADLLAWCRS